MDFCETGIPAQSCTQGWLAARELGWTKLNKQVVANNKTWILMAEEIVRLQKEQASAHKSKDKSKVKSLDVQTKKIDSRAKRVINDFNAIYDVMASNDKKLGEVFRAQLKPGI